MNEKRGDTKNDDGYRRFKKNKKQKTRHAEPTKQEPTTSKQLRHQLVSAWISSLCLVVSRCTDLSFHVDVFNNSRILQNCLHKSLSNVTLQLLSNSLAANVQADMWVKSINSVFDPSPHVNALLHIFINEPNAMVKGEWIGLFNSEIQTTRFRNSLQSQLTGFFGQRIVVSMFSCCDFEVFHARRDLSPPRR